MNVISFSVFGSAPIYCYGAVRNATEYPRVLGQDWKVVMWCDESVPRDIQLKLRQAGADVRTPPQPIANGMFWRFVILDDPKVERALFRDTDSRPIQREALAIKAWIASSKPFHSMADHPHHTLPMGGGLWGIDKTKIKGDIPHILCHMEDAIIRSRLAARTYTREKGYSLDQTFLTKHIWQLFRWNDESSFLVIMNKSVFAFDWFKFPAFLTRTFKVVPSVLMVQTSLKEH